MQGMQVVRRPLVSAHMAHKAHLAASTRKCTLLRTAAVCRAHLAPKGSCTKFADPCPKGGRTGRRGVSKAPLDKARPVSLVTGPARLIFEHFGAKRCRACRRCWVLALQNAAHTVKNCCSECWAVVLSVLHLLWWKRNLVLKMSRRNLLALPSLLTGDCHRD